MTFTKYLREMGEAILETPDGCTERQMVAFINLVKFFEYKTLAVQVIANAVCINGKYKCKVGTLAALF